jgi:hypothetical protein
MTWTPGRHSRLGLTRYHTTAAIGATPHRGELARYGDSCWLCCVRGPEGIMVALAEQLG